MCNYINKQVVYKNAKIPHKPFPLDHCPHRFLHDSLITCLLSSTSVMSGMLNEDPVCSVFSRMVRTSGKGKSGKVGGKSGKTGGEGEKGTSRSPNPAPTSHH